MKAFRLIALLCLLVVSTFTFAKPRSSGPNYGGGKHTTSHGGTYSHSTGGSSHKGGTYHSPTGNSSYGKHK